MSALTRRDVKVLLLCDVESPNLQNAILDNVAAILKYSQFKVEAFNPRQITYGRFLDFSRFDVVIIHFTLCIAWETYLPQPVRQRLKEYSGLKVQLIQDEYRFVNAMCEAMVEIAVDVVFTLAEGKAIKQLYHHPDLASVRFETVLPGYLWRGLEQKPIVALSERKLDVGYRARMAPFWWGQRGYDKVRIAELFEQNFQRFNLKTDISARDEDRIYGDAWHDFTSHCRTTLGVESGTSIADFDGSVEDQVKEYLQLNPGADFDEVSNAVLGDYEGNVDYGMLSPRVFEAAIQRTVMIMFPGHHSGVVEPWRHYIPLERDFSNAEEVALAIHNDDLLEEISARAYEDLVKSGRYDYQCMVTFLDQVIEEELRKKNCQKSRSFSNFIPLAGVQILDDLASEFYMLPSYCGESEGRDNVHAMATFAAQFVAMARVCLSPNAVCYLLGSKQAFRQIKGVINLERLLEARYSLGDFVSVKVSIQAQENVLELQVVEMPAKEKLVCDFDEIVVGLSECQGYRVYWRNDLKPAILHAKTPRVRVSTSFQLGTKHDINYLAHLLKGRCVDFPLH